MNQATENQTETAQSTTDAKLPQIVKNSDGTYLLQDGDVLLTLVVLTTTLSRPLAKLYNLLGRKFSFQAIHDDSTKAGLKAYVRTVKSRIERDAGKKRKILGMVGDAQRLLDHQKNTAARIASLDEFIAQIDAGFDDESSPDSDSD